MHCISSISKHDGSETSDFYSKYAVFFHQGLLKATKEKDSIHIYKAIDIASILIIGGGRVIRYESRDNTFVRISEEIIGTCCHAKTKPTTRNTH